MAEVNQMQKLHNPLVQTQETPTHRQKVFAFFKDKKEWIKLNASYVVATGTNFGVAMASAHLAQKAGVSKESATSWIAFVSGFTAGFAALVGTWYFLHVDKYQKDIGKIAKDAWTMFKNIWKAQIVSLAIIMPGSWIAASIGIATTLIVAAQQTVDRIIFIPAFNFFSRHQIKEMEGEKQQN